MNSVSAEVLLKQLHWRYAVKKFDSTRKISPADWATLQESLILAPSSYGLQPYKFVVVENAELRQKLRAAAWNQSQVEDASHVVVLAGLKKMSEAFVAKFLARTAEVRGAPVESLKAYGDMMIGDLVKGPRSQIALHWAQRQSYIAMGFLLETAALLGIDACPMEGLDAAKFDDILGLSSGDFGSVAMVTLGYRAADDKYAAAKKVRFDAKDLIDVRR